MNNNLKNIIFYFALFIIDFIFISFVVCKIDNLLYYSKFAAITALAKSKVPSNINNIGTIIFT